ncbi:hypothetical protein ND861_06920 [Leptospira sp. 2 VSF19]|uniref:Lipoprotein n=1 Tax=Leptospira soteropolitanensis TaxID=2950025 RepID=A0AAW5VML5_9LEPT|nr:hypothetical protein [Leptospira soteropolitanensis]MCW7492382.1 hypothetical protein [Leptospira soteropolitanensis]MCW7499962.1 hypothetical protein [Leptospira soteropolitanensis]MCW7522214.1 hypothetical protein [Leptospira soteropolitanensis]MCW7526069.1 hypothetical protein [Leptospira soteropolitanensis]MCW7529819.1 hypothetical protein [Leptospira soteropolitanensis]
MKKFIFSLVFVFGCNGIGGPSVLPYENFKSQAESYFYLKAIECGRIYATNSANTLETEKSANDQGLLGILVSGAAKSSEILSFSGPSFVRKDDAGFCFRSILAVPCGNQYSDFLVSHSVAYAMHCSPKKACMTSHQNFLQGDFCNR